MPSLLLKEVEGSGGGSGLSIGDYVQTERTELEDGKRLLTLDSSLLDSGEYPELSAVYGNKYKLSQYRPLGFNASSYMYGEWLAATEDRVYGTTIALAEAIQSMSTSSADRVITNEVAGTSGRESYDITASSDGQYIARLEMDKTNKRVYVRYSMDFGNTWTLATVTTTVKPRVLTPASTNSSGRRIKFNDDGSLLRLTYMQDNNSTQVFWESTDFGQTWTQIWIDVVTGLTTASESSLGEWSDDCSTYCCFVGTTAQAGGYMVRNGVRINPTLTSIITSGASAPGSISGDGTRVAIIRTPDVQYASYIPYNYSDDDGTTWIEQKINMQGESNEFTEVSDYLSVSNLCFSRVNKDYGYFLRENRSPVSSMITLIRLHLPSATYEIIGDVSTGTLATNGLGSRVNIMSRLTVDGKSEMVTLAGANDSNGASYETVEFYRFDYDKFLMPVKGSSLTKIVGDAL